MRHAKHGRLAAATAISLGDVDIGLTSVGRFPKQSSPGHPCDVVGTLRIHYAELFPSGYGRASIAEPFSADKRSPK